MGLVHIRSAQFPNVFLRLDGRGVTSPRDNGGGVANGQFGAGPWETYRQVNNPDGTVSFQSNTFNNVFLRLAGQGVTSPRDNGGGVANGQFGAGPWEKFRIVTNDDTTQSIASTAFNNVFLRLDGRGVTQPAGNGGGVANGQYSAGTLEKFVIRDCTTHAHAHGALDQFVQWFPEEADNINSRRQHIIDACCPPYNVPSHTLTALAAVQHAPSAEAATGQEQGSSGTPCAVAVGAVIYDAISLAMSLVGLRAVNQQRLRRAGYEAIGRNLNALQRGIEEFRLANGRVARASALFNLLGQIYNGGGFRAIFKIIKDEMSWWEWIKTGIIALAQFIAWFASEGAAFIAEAVLVIMSATQLIEDSVAVSHACP